MAELSGKWVGTIQGTNNGAVYAEFAVGDAVTLDLTDRRHACIDPNALNESLDARLDSLFLNELF